METMVMAHLDAAYRLAQWHVADRRDAEEVVYEASLQAVGGLARIPIARGRVWYLGLVSRICRERVGRGQSTPAAPRALHDPGPHRDDSDPVSADSPLVENAIRGLPFPLREALVLHEVEGLSYQELGEVMGVSTETAIVRLSQARRMLTDVLMRRAVAV
jgi:RNA polymerase sigma-70 factor (ECF subfamily)